MFPLSLSEKIQEYRRWKDLHFDKVDPSLLIMQSLHHASDFQKPSEKCLNALVAQNGGVIAFSGGDLKFDDQSCDDTKKGQLETAAWDALTLATFAGTSAPPRTSRDIASWKTYIGQLC
jgi:hypothetical protein